MATCELCSLLRVDATGEIDVNADGNADADMNTNVDMAE